MDVPQNLTTQETIRAFGRIGFLAEGRLLTGQAIATTATAIEHRLGRVPQGWVEVSPASANRATQASAPDENNLYLSSAAGAITASLWVW